MHLVGSRDLPLEGPVILASWVIYHHECRIRRRCKRGSRGGMEMGRVWKREGRELGRE